MIDDEIESGGQAPMVIEVPYSHLYPGISLDWSQQTKKDDQQVEVIILFGDGSSASAEIEYDDKGIRTLHVSAYTTSKGTHCSSRSWPILRCVQMGGTLEIQLGKRLE